MPKVSLSSFEKAGGAGAGAEERVAGAVAGAVADSCSGAADVAAEEESQGTEQDVAQRVGGSVVEVEYDLLVRLVVEEGRRSLKVVEDSAAHSFVVRSQVRVAEEVDILQSLSAKGFWPLRIASKFTFVLWWRYRVCQSRRIGRR